MTEKYFNERDLLLYFKKEQIDNKILVEEEFAVSSIGDIYYWIENYKKGNISNSDPIEMLKKFEKTVVYIADIDSDQLFNALFTFCDGDIDFWKKPINNNLHPKLSLNYISLKCNDSTPWSEDIVIQMEKFYNL